MAFTTYGLGGSIPKNYQRDFKDKDLTKEFDYDELWYEVFKSEHSPIPSILTKQHRIIFVDADAIVYRISAACEKNEVVADVKGFTVRFKNKTELKKWCLSLGVDVKDVESEIYTTVEPVKNVYETLKKTIAMIYRVLNATHVVFLLGGSYNFRHDLKLPNKYKSNRKTTRRPEHLPACREYLNKHYDTFLVSGIEADDCVQGMTEYVINATSAYGCAYQLDKDYHTSMTKNRYYHIANKEVIELRGGIGSLSKTKSGVKGDGLHWVLFQLMQGDASDGYSPKSLYNQSFKGSYGEVGYYKDFCDYTDEVELLSAWVNKWEEILPETIEFIDWNGESQKHNWLSLAELYFQCLYMRMSPEDDLSFEKLLLKYGVGVCEDTGHLYTFEVEKVDISESYKPKEESVDQDWEW